MTKGRSIAALAMTGIVAGVLGHSVGEAARTSTIADPGIHAEKKSCSGLDKACSGRAEMSCKGNRRVRV